MPIRLSSSRMDMNDKPLERPVIRDYGEAVNALGGGSGTRDIDLSLGNVVTAAVTGTTTFTFSNPTPAGTACTFTLLLTNGGAFTVNWPAAVKWANTEGNVAPTLNTGGVDVLTFLTTDVGLTWYGFSGTAVVSNDSLWGWGLASSGQNGDGGIANRSSPVQVGSLTTWTGIAAGFEHSHAVRSDGTLWSWGHNGSGHLGDNTNDHRSSPVQVGSLTTWTGVAAGDFHSFAIKADGTLWALGGRNSSGQLGDGSVTSRSSPVQVGSATWSTIGGGKYHTHGIRSNGTLWSWGSGSGGRLGDGATTSRSSPVQVGSLTTWISVSGGYSHGVALRSDGTLWAWGNSAYGALGQISSTTSRSSPVQVGSLTTWVAQSSGSGHVLALKSDGTLWAWGRGTHGQLGQGTSAVSRSSPVQVGSLTTWTSVNAGRYHSLAKKIDGTLWAWGRNNSGQLGDGSTADRSSPVQVGSLTTWKTLSAGAYHSVLVKRGV